RDTQAACRHGVCTPGATVATRSLRVALPPRATHCSRLGLRFPFLPTGPGDELARQPHQAGPGGLLDRRTQFPQGAPAAGGWLAGGGGGGRLGGVGGGPCRERVTLGRGVRASDWPRG